MDASQLKSLGRLEIITTLEKGAPYGGEIWQGGIKDRTVLQLSEIHLHHETGRILFKTSGFGTINSNLPVYVRLAYRNLIFALAPNEFKASGENLVCAYPIVAKALEERKNDRYLLPQSSLISLSLKKVEKTIKETVFDLEVRIVDVSEFGFGLLISHANRDYLGKFDHCWIKAIDQRPLYSELFGSVKYISPKGFYLKRGDIRVGLSLDKPIARDVFDNLRRRSSLTLTG